MVFLCLNPVIWCLLLRQALSLCSGTCWGSPARSRLAVVAVVTCAYDHERYEQGNFCRLQLGETCKQSLAIFERRWYQELQDKYTRNALQPNDPIKSGAQRHAKRKTRTYTIQQLAWMVTSHVACQMPRSRWTNGRPPKNLYYNADGDN